MLFVVGISKGNAMILAPPLGLWVFVMSLPRASSIESQTRQRRQARTSADRDMSPTLLRSWRLWLGALLSACVVVVFAQRISAGKTVDEVIAEEIADATKLFHAGKLEEALWAFRQIDVPSHLEKRGAQKYHNIGVTLLRLGRHVEASEALRQALAHDPNDVSARELLEQIAPANR